MTKKIEKRDGTLQDFNRQKIIEAIKKSFIAVDGRLTVAGVNKARRIAKNIEEEVLNTNTLYSVELIQDKVEEALMKTNRPDVARAYILYRNERTKKRKSKTELIKNIKEKIDASDVQNQNANVDEYSFGGRMGEARNELMKDYALSYIISPMARENHLNNEIYIHDLDSYAVGMHNCLTIPFDKLLAEGFNTRQTDVRPARSINTAFQLVAVIFQLQSLQQFGGVSASHLDWTMIPYIRLSFRKHFIDGVYYIEGFIGEKETCKKTIEIWGKAEDMPIDSPNYLSFKNAYKYAMDMTEKELMQAVQGMYHNLEIWA